MAMTNLPSQLTAFRNEQSEAARKAYLYANYPTEIAEREFLQPGRYPLPEKTTAQAGTGFNVSPAPQQGNGTFGAVPGQIGMPSPATDLGANFPNLAGTNAQLSSNILSKLRGELSPGTQAAIQDAAARFGVSSGMPGSGLAGYKSLRDLGLLSEQVQQQGIQDYASIIPTISRTQTVSPETQIGLAERNAMMAAAPDPTASNLYSQSLFNNYMRNMAQRSPAGSTTPWWMQNMTRGTSQSATPSSTPSSSYPSGGDVGYDEDNIDWNDAYNWLDVGDAQQGDSYLAEDNYDQFGNVTDSYYYTPEGDYPVDWQDAENWLEY